MTGPVRDIDGRRTTIAAALAEVAAHAEGAGRSEDSLMMLAAACLIGEDPLLAMVPEAHSDTVRRMIMPKRQTSIGRRHAFTSAAFSPHGTRIVTVSDDHRAIIIWEGGRVGGDWGSCLSYGQRRAIIRLGLAAAGISTDIPGDRIEGIDDEPDMYREDPHAQTVRAIVRRAVAGN